MQRKVFSPELGKCHFMVWEGIVLGHKVSEHGIEVDRAKIEVIEQLPLPTNVKEIRSFLGHVGFYRHFIKNFSQITRPLTRLLAKDALFIFDNECYEPFQTLKQALISAPIIQPPDWMLPFEICVILATLILVSFSTKQRIKSTMLYPMLAKP